MVIGWDESLTDTGSHCEVAEGGNGIDQEGSNVDGPVSVAYSLRGSSEEEGSQGHTTKDGPEDSLTELGNLLGAGTQREGC